MGERSDEPGGPRSEPEAVRRGTPRWALVAGLVLIAVVILLAVLLIAGGGHGPGRHM